MHIKQLQTSLQKEKKTSGKNARRKLYLKQTEINTIIQKLITIQQSYENNLKEVKKPPDDVKRINKEREGKWKRLTTEIDNTKKKIKSLQKDKAELEKQCSNLKSVNLKLKANIGHQDKETTTETYHKKEITKQSKCYACGSQEHQIRGCSTDRNIV